MAEPITQIEASANACGVFNKVTDAAPDEFPASNLPAFVIGAMQGDFQKFTNTRYGSEPVISCNIVQAAGDGEAALTALRKAFLAQLFDDDPAAEAVDFDRAYYMIGGDRLRFEIIRIRYTEETNYV